MNGIKKLLSRKESERENLDLGFDVVNGIAALDLQRDGLSGQSLDEDLHVDGWERECGREKENERLFGLCL